MLINENDTHVLQEERTTRYFISQDVATTGYLYWQTAQQDGPKRRPRVLVRAWAGTDR
jgi:hypothetical protein